MSHKSVTKKTVLRRQNWLEEILKMKKIHEGPIFDPVDSCSHVTSLACHFTFDLDQKWFFVKHHVNSIEITLLIRIKSDMAGQRRHVITRIFHFLLDQKLDGPIWTPVFHWILNYLVPMRHKRTSLAYNIRKIHLAHRHTPK